jgi:hypothetical protein
MKSHRDGPSPERNALSHFPAPRNTRHSMERIHTAAGRQYARPDAELRIDRNPGRVISDRYEVASGFARAKAGSGSKGDQVKILAKAVAGAVLAAGAVVAPLSVEAAAAPLPASASVTAVTPSLHRGMLSHTRSHGISAYRHTGELRRYCHNDRVGLRRHHHHNHCRTDVPYRYTGLHQFRYDSHHILDRDCYTHWRR